MSVYITNESEKEALKAILLQQAMILGLYSNQIIPDGSTVFGTLTELVAGGVTYGYARKELANDVVEGAAVADKWSILTNAAGKASAVYAAAVQEWTFLAPDVALAPTVYGVFGFCLVLPFTAGSQPIKPGDVIYQTTQCAEVVAVNVTSGSWALGTAAGNLYLKRQVGTFVTGASLIDASRGTSGATPGEIKVLAAAPAVAGTGYAVGDRFKIAGAGTGAVGRVTSISGGGATGPVTGVELLTGGRDYTVAVQATTKIDGGGDGNMTITVTSLYTAGPAVVVATLSGDSSKKLMFVEALTTPIPVTTLGQKISYTPTLTMSTG